VNIKLFCCPYAGAGASAYRGWSVPVGSGVDLRPVQLPGREELFAQELCETMGELASHVLGQIRAVTSEGEEIALFGHSFGAALAFEVAARITRSGEFRLTRLFASGAPAPTMRVPFAFEDLGDDDFLARFESLIGFRHAALAEPELRDIVLPVLRADVRARASYQADAAGALCAQWEQVTSAAFELTELPGDHMFFVRNPDPLLSLFVQVLAAPAASYGAS
jgi:surfactin synthase thioesterase subunit